MEWVKQLANYAGPVALAAFAGVFLGGIALSFFWKNFGPWKLLEACRKECAECTAERETDSEERAKMRAEFADLKARHEVLTAAVQRGGLGLQLGPTKIAPDVGV